MQRVHIPDEEYARPRKPVFSLFLQLCEKKAEQITHVDRAFRKTFSVNPGIVSMTTNMLLLCWSM